MHCPEHETQNLTDNYNTGIEYEFGVACALMDEAQHNDFFVSIVESHINKDTILNVCDSTKKYLQPLLEKHACNDDYYISLASTQDDSLGASDVLVCCENKILFGVSVKFANKNNWNPSSRNFIKNDTIDELRKKYQETYLPKYKDDMRKRFGKCKVISGAKNTWSRKTSNITTDFINLIREKVIEEWNIKTKQEKEAIMGKGFQIFSPIKYYTIVIKNDLSCEINEPEIVFSVDEVNIEKHKTSFIVFKVKNKIVVKLQVKFNNGFIEKAKKETSSTFQIDEILFKNGDPFGSWNFNI